MRKIALGTLFVISPWAIAAAAPAPDAENPNVAVARRPDIVGGSTVKPGEWPDVAAVRGQGDTFCTGTLISPTVVLTAGHCIGGVDSVRLAVNDYDDESGETIRVAREIEYPGSWKNYDVGILILEKPAVTPPRLIAQGCVLDKFAENGAKIEIVGYGATDEQGYEYDSLLRQGETLIQDVDCTSGRGCNDNVSPSGELGAGGNGVDTCFGDSGGPAYLPTPFGDYLIGVTSRGYYDISVPCGEGGIYTRPDAVWEWIEEEAGVELPRATCNTPPVPSTDMLTVTAGETVDSVIVSNDENTDDEHSYEIASPPMHGEVTIDADGTLHYTAFEDYAGEDSFTVRVSDNGVPALSTELSVAVTVEEPETGGCGCQNTSSNGAAWFAALALLGFARVRSRKSIADSKSLAG